MTANKKFSAEIGKVLNLMINSLYTNEEIALRELISNASDACDKLRYSSQLKPELVQGDPDFRIEISVNKPERQLIITDNGTGMNDADLEANLGSIATSGTEAFKSALAANDKKDSNLIGQFGVGFYSSFMIAAEVTVISKKAGEDKAYIWRSKGEDEYSIEEYKGEAARGTKIILSLKEDKDAFLDHFKIKNIIKTYSDHISIPINFIDETGNKVQVNSSSALWKRPKGEISPEQYKEFYHSVSYSVDDPWMIIHNKGEGIVEYTNLLFIPTLKTFDLFHPDRKRRVKLYIKRVFITDENIDLIPHYLRFLRGVIDSEDLPLNISRENLQHNLVLEKIKSLVTKKVLSELKIRKQETREEYENFWKNFGQVMKEGLCDSIPDPEKLMELCLFKSALHDKMISLDEYIAEMKEGQKTIYYLSGENAEKLKQSAQIEGFLSKNIDVLLFTDHVDDFWVNVLNNYKNFEIKSVTRSGVDLEEGEKSQESEAKEEADNQFTSLTERFKGVLASKVKEVRISKKLTNSPVCLAVDEGAMDIRMERFLIEQKQISSSAAKILEINPNHKIINKLKEDIENNLLLEETNNLIEILFDQACIIEGEPVTDAASFSKRLNQIIEKVYS